MKVWGTGLKVKLRLFNMDKTYSFKCDRVVEVKNLQKCYSVDILIYKKRERDILRVREWIFIYKDFKSGKWISKSRARHQDSCITS